MHWISGRSSVTLQRTIRSLPNTSTATGTARGNKNRRAETFGCRTTCLRTGLPIATATGTGFLLGAGPGSTTRLGALLPITMAVGTGSAAIGDGALVRSPHILITVLRMSAFSVRDLVSALASAGVGAGGSVGSRSAGVSRIIRGITAAITTGTTSTFTTRIFIISTSTTQVPIAHTTTATLATRTR